MAALSVACADEITDTNCSIHSLSEHEHEKPSMVITVPAVISSVSGSSRAGTFVFAHAPCNKHNNRNQTNQQSLFSHNVPPRLQMVDAFSIPL
jgi:hypothetical protein